VNLNEGHLIRLGSDLCSGVYGELLFLIHFGSSSEGSDADYLAVFDSRPLSPCVLLGNLDLWATDKEELKRYISLLDPVVTEPLLTGQFVEGKRDSYEEARQWVYEVMPNTEVVSHLLRRSFVAFMRASEYCRVVEQDNNRLQRREFWSSLSYSMSYWCFARHYLTAGQGVLSLQELVCMMHEEIRELWDIVQGMKKEGVAVDANALHRWARTMISSHEM